jgi:S1-C subfamily serine protease
MRRIVSYGPAIVVLAAAGAAFLAAPALMRRHAIETQRAEIVLARQSLGEDDILRRLDAAVTAVADATLPSVVHIDVAGGERGRFGSSGAGWVYDLRGRIVTNAHVVRGAEAIQVEFFDGRSVAARLIGSDPLTDIAVLETRGDPTVFPMPMATELPRRGERVFAFGSPFGFKFSMSEGIVSALGREPLGLRALGGFTNYIQTDAAVNPGNSGGPLVNAAAQLIGMNVAIATASSSGSSLDERTGDSAGISFAIPLGTIVPIVEQLVEHGTVERGFLGISFRGSQRERDADGNLRTGVGVSGVSRGGPADEAGLREGDLILTVRNEPATNEAALRSIVASTRPGTPVPVRVLRGGAEVDLTVELARMPDEVLVSQFVAPQIAFRLGLIVAEEDGRVFVQQVWPGTAGDAQGFRVREQIVSVEGLPVNSREGFYLALAQAGALDGRDVTVTVTAEDGTTREVETNLFR